MGTSFVLVSHQADRSLLDDAVALIDDLESRWSRFITDSEISRLNRSPGVPVIVSPDTFAVVQAAVDGAVATGGRFDPTVHDSLIALGYDRTFDLIDNDRIDDPEGEIADHRPAPGVAGIELDDALHAITLPPGVRLDLGGIGKGTAADHAAGLVMSLGALGVAVSIGGDVRVRGESPSGSGWRFTDDDGQLPFPVIADGGICTSTTRRRRWATVRGEVHHIVDPSTGAPTDGTIECITVVGATAQQAEILTKAAMVAGSDATSFLASFGVPHVIRWSTAA